MTSTTPRRAPTLTPLKFKKSFTEFIGIGENGNLWVEGCDCAELAERFGTPLYIISESQFRYEYRRWRDAFTAEYPDTEVLFANKSNNGLAYRHIMNQEGAGGDCFGVNEMYLALLAGTDPKTLVLNGSNKGPEEIEMAVENGLCINIDGEDELDIIHETSQRLGKDVDIGIRLKLDLEPLRDRHGVAMHGPGTLRDQAMSHKWGMSFEQTVGIVQRVQAEMPRLHLMETHYHLSRMDKLVEDFAVMAREMIQWSARLRDATGWNPPSVDLGGGWTYGRSTGTGPGGVDDDSSPTPTDYAKAVGDAIRDECARHDLPLPKLKIEPGRVISGPSGVAIGKVGAVKDLGYKKWVNVDLSSNHVPWAFLIDWHYDIVPVVNTDAPGTEIVDIVGPLCNADELGKQRTLPALGRGDLIAMLDTGGYTESTAGVYNAQARPATILVHGAAAEITTEREQLSDIVGRFRVPPRLLAGSFGTPTQG
jgi:diaminopimelate decarboxylase